MKSILDPSFKYANSSSTDLRATFARIRKQQQEEAQARDAAANDCTPSNVVSIPTRKEAK